ncbi:GcrA cell cycle regulator [Agrobacterium rubi]|uniref:Cell cycle regulator GcrA n=1 Tax=Agrobacterium rubi TR3 = NBRC 13261 TaxID=1368415 RepID=A0A081CUI1_9HYPH|nr:GcrA family cell cycle regulator [Agrobacterium rubi]MBP1879181.1 GcrA cell cycle regulator [Agrobacterium rubi]MCL6652480.1 GcrA cell cycle regulator [Agrobacterium rubi]NTF06364.1 GcrA cell cycle regulator [Agrobacterium rubi]NTF18605.1 GcrA cell cycle regulator [Agrobacterium rubi]NTF25569.1 GcrA cell cycle regulator [Agrobacterium rubi]
MNWTDERVERLKRLWAEGLSASQIAAQLGGVSRNAVIGKVHRLNLPGRAKAGGTVSTSRPAAAKRPAAATTSSAPRAANTFQARAATPRPTMRTAPKDDQDSDSAQVLEYVPVNTSVLPTSLRLTLTELTERTCKWPVGDPLKDDFHFCGCDASESSPYCKFHAKMAYQPVSERRRA